MLISGLDRTRRRVAATLIALTFSLAFVATAAAWAADQPATKPDPKADPKIDPKIELADGKLLLQAPASWVRKAPRNRIVEHEFAIPAAKDDPEEGRLTVMGAGGDVDANIERWINQFDQADGSATKNQVPEADRKKTIAGLEVRFVDLMGTFKDSPRPLDPTVVPVQKPNYRMLAAIVTAPKLGNYFFKFYGPRQTVSDHAEEFRKMIGGLEKK